MEFCPDDLEIIDVDAVDDDTADVTSRGVMGCEIYAADGELIEERTLLAGKKILLPHPFIRGSLMTMAVRKRSKDGEAYAYGHDHVAALAHDDERGWYCTCLLNQKTFGQVAEVVGV